MRNEKLRLDVLVRKKNTPESATDERSDAMSTARGRRSQSQHKNPTR